MTCYFRGFYGDGGGGGEKKMMDFTSPEEI
jgi:hypothetical protein